MISNSELMKIKVNGYGNNRVQFFDINVYTFFVVCYENSFCYKHTQFASHVSQHRVLSIINFLKSSSSNQIFTYKTRSNLKRRYLS